MSYLIDGKRISRHNRQRLLAELERVDRERIRLLARVTEAIADEHRDAIALQEESARADIAETQRDQALHECDVLRGERDRYKKESVDNWLKLTASEDKLSQERARVSSYDRRVGELERQNESMFTGSHVAWAFFWGVAITVALCIAGALLVGCTTPTSPAPVCKQFGFSPTTGRDSSWVVSCVNNNAHEAQGGKK